MRLQPAIRHFLAFISYTLLACEAPASTPPLEASLVDSFTGSWETMGKTADGDKSVVGQRDPDGFAFYLGDYNCRLNFKSINVAKAELRPLPFGGQQSCFLLGKRMDLSAATARAEISWQKHSSCALESTNTLKLSLVTTQGNFEYSGSGRFDFVDNCPDCKGKQCAFQ